MGAPARAVVGEGSRGAAVNAAQPVSSRRINPADGRGRFARNCSPAVCTIGIVADAPDLRQLPPELTAALFWFALGLICGIGLTHPPKDQP